MDPSISGGAEGVPVIDIRELTRRFEGFIASRFSGHAVKSTREDTAASTPQRVAGVEIDLYIGDGATITRLILRNHAGVLIGHVQIGAQLGWCSEEQVRTAIFTHCGSQIVGGDERVLGALVRRLGQERQVCREHRI
jgi:hypothetical protein